MQYGSGDRQNEGHLWTIATIVSSIAKLFFIERDSLRCRLLSGIYQTTYLKIISTKIMEYKYSHSMRYRRYELCAHWYYSQVLVPFGLVVVHGSKLEIFHSESASVSVLLPKLYLLSQ